MLAIRRTTGKNTLACVVGSTVHYGLSSLTVECFFMSSYLRQITQLNAGKKTPRLDGKASLSFEERLNLSRELKSHFNNWIHQLLREIPIPKKDGKTRILKLPTIADRTCLCLVKSAMEPALFRNFHLRELRI